MLLCRGVTEWCSAYVVPRHADGQSILLCSAGSQGPFKGWAGSRRCVVLQVHHRLLLSVRASEQGGCQSAETNCVYPRPCMWHACGYGSPSPYGLCQIAYYAGSPSAHSHPRDSDVFAIKNDGRRRLCNVATLPQ